MLNQIYDPRTDTWRSGAPFNARRDFAMAVASPEGIHLIAGRDAQFKADHQVYDPRSDTWSFRAPLPEAIDAASIERYGNRIFVIGGNDRGTPLSGVYIYDRIRDRWSTGAPMPTPRFSAASAVHRGRILVAGGQTPGRQTTNVLEAYHPAQDRWESLASMPFDSEGLGAGTVLRGGIVGNRFCVFGGRLGPPSANALADTYCYDTSRDMWTVGPDMLTPRIEMAFTDHGGAVYAIGGRTREAPATGTTERLGGGTGR